MKMFCKSITTGVLKDFFFIVLGALALSSVAFYNEYPLLTSDSATYIRSAFSLKLNNVDTIAYSFFIHLFSFNNSLWSVVFSQSFIYAFTIFHFMKIFENINTRKTFPFIIIGLALFTGAPWYSSMVMTDIFTGIGFMALFILFFKKEMHIRELITFSIIAIFSILTHKSHFLLFTFVAIMISVAFIIINKSWKAHRRFILVLAIVLIAWPLNILLNQAVSGNAEMKSSSHIFIMARLNQTNMLKKVLDKTCDKYDFCICKYKEKLPSYRGAFKWDKKVSPVYQCGGWEGTKEEFNKIIWLSFSSPRLIFWHINDAFQATMQQLISFRIGRLFGNQRNHNYTKNAVRKYYRTETPQFLNSLQNTDRINFHHASLRQGFTIFLSIVTLLLVSLSIGKNMPLKDKKILIITLFFIFCNAMVTAPLAGVSDRYVGRVIYLVPLITFLLIVNNRHMIRNYFNQAINSKR